MSLMRKIALIFISVTIISSIFFYMIGRGIIEQISSGELERGPGRTNGVISKINGDINKISGKCLEFAEYYSIKDRLIINEGLNEKNADEIIAIDKKADKAPVSSIILLNKDFKISKLLKNKDNLKNSDIDEISAKAKKILNEEEYKEKAYFAGIITSKEYPYMVSVKKINNKSNSDFILIIEKMDQAYIETLKLETFRSLNIVKEKEEGTYSDADIEKVELYNREYYTLNQKDTLDFYTKIDSLENTDGDFYIKLMDTKEVRNNAQKNINALILIIILLTITANVISYFIIKKNVIKPILDVSKAVNNIKGGKQLDVKLKEYNTNDEMSLLNRDLNSMFKRLKSYSDNLEIASKKDSLTGLSNRYSINKYMRNLTNKNQEFALLFIDLDNFKGINDTLGHDIGDDLLIIVSNELTEFVKADENLTVGRLGGDEFIIIRKGKNNIDEINALACEILIRINKLYDINSYIYEVKASMGISYFPQHATDDRKVLQYSDIAMYCSKKSGGNDYNIFNETMLEPLRIEKRLKRAIENKEFEMYLQPIYSVNNDKIGGYEALIRWNIDGEVIRPDKFISLAKRTGDIVGIDNFILSKAIETCRDFLNKGQENFYISVNASKLFLKQKTLIPFILNELKKNNVPSKYVKIEVTEDEIIEDFEYTIDILSKIREIGIEVYLDDFGVGYSSFSHIKKLPIDVIKIDRSMLIDIDSNIKTQQIVNTMIILAHNLNMGIICEGIELENQVEILKNLKCDNIQGYYFSKPLAKDEFENFIKNNKNRI